VSNQETGQLGEKLASAYLRKHGYKIIETNYRCAHGEIDILARHKHTLVFIEVKCRRNRDFGLPVEAVTAGKQKKMVAAALYYLQTHPQENENWRIDVVSIELAENNKPAKISIIENAVGG
jgi:putative endonuclease